MACPAGVPDDFFSKKDRKESGLGRYKPNNGVGVRTKSRKSPRWPRGHPRGQLWDDFGAILGPFWRSFQTFWVTLRDVKNNPKRETHFS